TVQRSVDGSQWDDLKNIPGVISFSRKKYQYTDHITNGGNRFYYRIKMTLFSGATLYTRIILAEIRKQEAFNLFPNPARNEIIVSCSDNANISLFSISGEKIKVRLEKINSNQVKINTSFLKPGLYIIKVGEKQRQLIIQ
ncbi:MAG TPA: T9SS type A sorting domain-containing protein, partial [Chitinophagaceae bacterium]|nr:T9SS type A sorting domain-containing protein [Chitinophagaceae bacterium]